MALNSICPTTFTTAVLICDTVKIAGGSSDAITAKITQSVAFDVQSTEGGIKFPQMTTDQREDLVVETDQNGNTVYDITLDAPFMVVDGAWAEIHTAGNSTNIIDNGSSLIVGTGSGNSIFSGTENAFFGDGVGPNITSSSQNTGVGYHAFNSLTLGDNNVSVGALCLVNLTEGSQNTAGGFGALGNLTDSNSNTAFGYLSCNVIEGQTTTGVGAFSFELAEAADQSVAIGASAGSSQVLYQNCTFLGFEADASVNSLTNAAALGYSSVVSVDNGFILGNASSLVGIGTSSPTSSLHVVSAGIAANLQGGQIVKVRTNAGTTATLGTTDFILGQTSTASSITVTLPAIVAGNTNQIFTVKDQSGLANTHNITVNTTGGKLIDGAGSQAITANYGWLSVYNDGTQWYIYNAKLA